MDAVRALRNQAEAANARGEYDRALVLSQKADVMHALDVREAQRAAFVAHTQQYRAAERAERLDALGPRPWIRRPIPFAGW